MTRISRRLVLIVLWLTSALDPYAQAAPMKATSTSPAPVRHNPPRNG